MNLSQPTKGDERYGYWQHLPRPKRAWSWPYDFWNDHDIRWLCACDGCGRRGTNRTVKYLYFRIFPDQPYWRAADRIRVRGQKVYDHLCTGCWNSLRALKRKFDELAFCEGLCHQIGSEIWRQRRAA